MRGKTHAAFAVALSFLFSPQDTLQLLLYAVALLFFGLLPDIDEPTSILGRKVKIVGWLLKHRGILHAVWIYGLLGYFMGSWFGSPWNYLVWVGSGSHLFLDSLTKNGIQPLWPLPIFWHGEFKTGGTLDTAIWCASLLAIAYFLVSRAGILSIF